MRTFTKGVRDNGSQLNVGNRETVLETVLLAGHKAGQFKTIAHQITKLSDISGWHKATGNKIMLEEVSNPFGIFIVVFLAFNSAYPFRVGNDDIGNMGFQYIVDRNIVLASRFHAYILTVVLNQPVSKADQVVVKSRESFF